ncbi:MAG: ribonuclease [Dorea sp.]|nr:ribonuclease [Dorea sp.]
MKAMNTKSCFGKLKALFTSMLLVLMVLGASLLGGCGVSDVSSDTKEAPLQIETLAEEAESLLTIESDTDSFEVGSVADTEAIAETEAIVETEKVTETEAPVKTTEAKAAIDEDGSYSSKEEVALYIHTYGKLPSNFITKKDAEALGWNSSKGNLWKVADGKSIGGSYFGNYEEKLPKKKGRQYYECDINYDGGYRGAERIIYSNDGLIFYTNDHYETFEQLY